MKDIYYLKQLIRRKIEFKNIPKEFWNDTICKVALRQNPTNIQYIENQLEEYCMFAVSNNYENLQYIKNPSEKVIDMSLNKSGHALLFIENPTENQQMLALKETVDIFRSIKNPTNEMINYALSKNALLIKRVKNPTLQQIIIAAQTDYMSLSFVEKIPRNIFQKLCKSNVNVLRFSNKFNFIPDEHFLDELISLNNMSNEVWAILYELKFIDDDVYNKLFLKSLSLLTDKKDIDLIYYARTVSFKTLDIYFKYLNTLKNMAFSAPITNVIDFMEVCNRIDTLIDNTLNVFYHQLNDYDNAPELYNYIYLNHFAFFDMFYVPSYMQTLNMQKSFIKKDILNFKNINDSAEIDEFFNELIKDKNFKIIL